MIAIFRNQFESTLCISHREARHVSGLHKVREAGWVVQVATVVAIGVTERGDRTVLGAATGACEDHQFCTSFLRSLVKRGLKGVWLVISDAHERLR